ncbi:uncharacterized protein [Battus philenor]|uniref:uncharacterized protein n=1 Tax=Battus philenor TaxID=42288 RepID=UPI0035CF6D13
MNFMRVESLSLGSPDIIMFLCDGINMVWISTTSQTDSVFTKCCCCIPLRIGCFILGYINLVFNSIHTFLLLVLTVFIGYATHGFDHIDSDRDEFIGDGVTDRVMNISSFDKPVLTNMDILLMAVLFANICWLGINVACLIGLHKKRPGPIKVYVAFAMARIIVMFSGLVYLIIPGNTDTNSIISYCFDLGLAAYFILVYYIYAMQLEREQARNQEASRNMSKDTAFVYPPKIDKQALVV